MHADALQAHLTGSLGPKPDDLDIPQKDPSDTPWLIEHQYLTRISFLHVEQWKEIRLAFKYHLESSAAKVSCSVEVRIYR